MAQKSRWVEGTSTHFHIERLHDVAALSRPVLLQGKNEALKSAGIGCFFHD
jgi:hypothetical protein